MIRLIEGDYASFYEREINVMHRNRAEVFHDRLGWDVEVKNGWERDYFDDLNPLYLVSVDDETNVYRASLRLLPTTGPNMLRDVFPQLLGNNGVIESATIWESSRICATLNGGQRRTASGVAFALVELICGIAEVVLLAGLTEIVSVFDARMLRVLRAAGAPFETIGQPQRIGVVTAYAGVFDPDQEQAARLREQIGAGNSVLDPTGVEIVFPKACAAR